MMELMEFQGAAVDVVVDSENLVDSVGELVVLLEILVELELLEETAVVFVEPESMAVEAVVENLEVKLENQVAVVVELVVVQAVILEAVEAQEVVPVFRVFVVVQEDLEEMVAFRVVLEHLVV